MDLKGSLVDTNLRIYPTERLISYLETLPVDDIPINIVKVLKGTDYTVKKKELNDEIETTPVQLNNKDIENLNKIRQAFKNKNIIKDTPDEIDGIPPEKSGIEKTICDSKDNTVDDTENANDISHEEAVEKPYLTTSDINWLYDDIQKKQSDGDKDVPYLNVLLEGAIIDMPKNKVIKRNPVLEARCVKLRAQQNAREYRKMTRTVDNVRIRYPEDSISYQLKQINRHLIAVGQFILSIFAGFLFGFRGVEWMVGNLDFGFRMLLGVMCALIIALAEIYFLAKKLNEELFLTETVQIGGPPKLAGDVCNGPKLAGDVCNGPKLAGDVCNGPKVSKEISTKEHVD